MKRHFNRRSTRQLYSILLITAFSTLAVMLASGCGSNLPRQSTATPTLTLTATFPPTLTPTPEPLGSISNPYVIGLVSAQQDPQVAAAGAELATQIGKQANAAVTSKVFITYNQLMESMENGEIHAAWMPPLTYLYARSRGIANVALLTNQFGVYSYGTQILANVDSQLEPFYDPISGLSSADAATALAQLQDKRPCWVDLQSASGYILPAGLLRINEIPTAPGAVIQSHPAVVRALYIKGICDFGATFAISGDPRTASAVQADLPDVMNRVLIIWRSDAVIPNTSLALLASMPEGNRQTLTTAFLDLSRTSEGKALLALSAGSSQIEEMKPVTDDIYDPLRQAVSALNLNLGEMLGK